MCVCVCVCVCAQALRVFKLTTARTCTCTLGVLDGFITPAFSLRWRVNLLSLLMVVLMRFNAHRVALRYTTAYFTRRQSLCTCAARGTRDNDIHKTLTKPCTYFRATAFVDSKCSTSYRNGTNGIEIYTLCPLWRHIGCAIGRNIRAVYKTHSSI